MAVAALLGAAAVTTLVVTTAAAAKSKPSIELNVSPKSLSVAAGTTGDYDVQVLSRNGFAGAVTIGTQSIPGGVTAIPQPAGPQQVTPEASAKAAIHVAVPADAHAGRRQFAVTAASPGVSTQTVWATLNVLPPPPLTVTADRATLSTAQGDRVEVDMKVVGPPNLGPVSLVVGGLPEGVSASVAPAQVAPAERGSPEGSVRLTLTTTPQTPVGTHTLSVSTTSLGVTHPARIVLTVIAGSEPFAITASIATPLRPGTTQPLDVALTNPNDTPIKLTSLVVAIGVVDDAHARCAAADNYAVSQFRGNLARLVVPRQGHTSLSRLGIPTAQWPTVSMVETHTNQDACKGARLGLVLSARAKGGVA